ncbi:MAG: RidA family protein [Gammaproteobacteria bacterium]|nr:RidA family protein [Gammaproteobacteria bacterium]
MRVVAALAMLVLGGCDIDVDTGKGVEYLAAPDAASQNLPFSEAVRVDDTLYLSGELGRLPGTLELVEGGIGPQTRQTMDNIAATLARHGGTMNDVVKCTIFMADMSQWAAMNEVYRTYFAADALPARSALGASALAVGASVEIECIAVVD